VFVGPGAAFEGAQGLRFPGEFPDGVSHTILVAEGGQPVPWTQPQELAYDPDKPLPPLGGGVSPRGFYAGLGDGSCRFIEKGTAEATVRALITRGGGEALGPEW
jgi:hypothetical protein